ncbi:hypothetical protein BGZ76_005416 [Entomortierella beljakovae]|nr:hypothetical protein BGZ76_005416 [Entomortierella beljakovae]
MFDYLLNRGKVAVVFIGNAGAGKSTLLSQIGGNFKSGAAFRRGYTTEKKEMNAIVDGQDVILMDVPGLFEPNENATVSNSKKLTKALSSHYNFKLFFVLKASNSGINNDDMVMMSKVNESVKQADGSPVSFRVIINQIMDQKVHDMYQESVAKDNMKHLFSTMEMEGYSFDIKIDNVLLLPFNKDTLEKRGLGDIIAKEVTAQQAVQLNIAKGITLTNGILEVFTNLLKMASGITSKDPGNSTSSGEATVDAGHKVASSSVSQTHVPTSSQNGQNLITVSTSNGTDSPSEKNNRQYQDQDRNLLEGYEAEISSTNNVVRAEDNISQDRNKDAIMVGNGAELKKLDHIVPLTPTSVDSKISDLNIQSPEVSLTQNNVGKQHIVHQSLSHTNNINTTESDTLNLTDIPLANEKLAISLSSSQS